MDRIAQWHRLKMSEQWATTKFNIGAIIGALLRLPDEVTCRNVYGKNCHACARYLQSPMYVRISCIANGVNDSNIL